MSKQRTRAEIVIEGVKAIRQSGLAGDFGVGGVVGLLVGMPLYLLYSGPSVFGVPASMVWGMVAAITAALISVSVGSVPKDSS